MATAKKAAAKKAVASKKTTTAAKPATPRKANAAFLKPMKPSPTLAAIIGAEPLPRTEVTRKIWEYIKKHDLQDPNARRNINGDEKLKALFGKPTVDMFELTKIVNAHLS